MLKCNNTNECSCTYQHCTRHGKCCECVAYHRKNNEFPGCFFSKDGEKTYDRSFENLVKDRRNY